MHATIYIDGYNLYFGCLHKTDYKWLDLHALFIKTLRSQQSQTNGEKIEITKIKYFTAPVISKFSRLGIPAHNAQNTYWRALRQKYPEHIEIIEGYNDSKQHWLYDASSVLDLNNKRKVWRIEEKQTDVQIAITMIADAMHTPEEAHCHILVSNDSD